MTNMKDDLNELGKALSKEWRRQNKPKPMTQAQAQRLAQKKWGKEAKCVMTKCFVWQRKVPRKPEQHNCSYPGHPFECLSGKDLKEIKVLHTKDLGLAKFAYWEVKGTGETWEEIFERAR